MARFRRSAPLPSEAGRERPDDGFSLVEVVLAIAILSVAIAATTAALSLAASVRGDNDSRQLAAEIANEAMQRAEAFGCGLPVGYNGVGADERLAACDYDPGDTSEGAGLADVDYTIERGGESFDVEVRMRWHLLNPMPSTFRTYVATDPTIGQNVCKARRWWANGYLSGGHFVYGVELPDDAMDPTLLSRTVTVTPENGNAVVLNSTETIRSELADPHHSGFIFSSSTANQKYDLEQIVSNVSQYTITLHSDAQTCAWFPYLEYGTMNYRIGSTDYDECDDTANTNTNWSGTQICHVHAAR